MSFAVHADSVSRWPRSRPQPEGNSTMTNQRQTQYENRSRFALATPAIRPGMHGRVLLSGPSGAGKTYTALLIAGVLAGADRVTSSIVMIDTEKNSGKTYADEFPLADGTPGYLHLPWQAPYNPTDLAMTMRDISNSETRVVIVDSQSHFWRGQGGTLDVASGRYTGWGEARPMHADMVDAMLECEAHVILCARSTQEHVQEKDDRDKWVVRKLGMKIQQDADLEYEVNVALTIDMQHTLYVSKSRTRRVPVATEYISGHAEEFAGVYRDWLEAGEPAATKEQRDNVLAALNRIDDAALRQQAKRDFIDTFGRPEMLLVSRLDEAAAWVANRVLGVDETSDRAPDDDSPPDDKGTEQHETHEHGEEPPADLVDAAERVVQGQGTEADHDAVRQATDPQEDAASDGTQNPVSEPTPPAPDAQTSTQTGSQPPADTPKTELQLQIEREVDGMSTPAEVRTALQQYGLKGAGTFKKMKQQLVAKRLEAQTTEV